MLPGKYCGRNLLSAAWDQVTVLFPGGDSASSTWKHLEEGSGIVVTVDEPESEGRIRATCGDTATKAKE